MVSENAAIPQHLCSAPAPWLESVGLLRIPDEKALADVAVSRIFNYRQCVSVHWADVFIVHTSIRQPKMD